MDLFDEKALYQEIVKVWGEYGAHAEVFRDLQAASQGKQELIEALQTFIALDPSFSTTCDRHLA